VTLLLSVAGANDHRLDPRRTDLFYPPIGSWIAQWGAAGIDPKILVPYIDLYDKAAYDAMRALREPVVAVPTMDSMYCCIQRDHPSR
jgi:hypothetical protein